MKYFAYGSNLCTSRLRQRVPSAEYYARASLGKYILKFNKRSIDRSGKCNVFFTGDPGDKTLGVIFEIEPAEKPRLDQAEGPGYRERQVEVITPDKNIVTAFLYVARNEFVDDSLRPYGWYKDLVVGGARQHGLPEQYINRLEMVESVADIEPERSRKNRRLLPC